MCLGVLGETGDDVVVVKNYRKPLVFMRITKQELVSAFGEQEFGQRVWKYKLCLLKTNLKTCDGTSRTTATLTQAWEYSEGYLTIEGRIPNRGGNFSASLVHVSEEDPDRE